MDYQEFIEKIRIQGGFESEQQASEAVQATLQTLNERMYGYEAQNLALYLPEELRVYLRTPAENELFTLDEFYKRVAEREGSNPQAAAAHARAVMEIIQENLSPSEVENFRAQFPEDFSRLFHEKR